MIYYFYYEESNLFQRDDQTENRDVYIVVSRPADMENLFLKGEIDGFLMAHPIAAKAVLENNKVHYYAHSSSIWPNHPGSTLTAVTDDEEVLLGLTWAHVKATNLINDPRNEKQVIKYAMEFSGQTEEVVTESLKFTKHTHFPSKEVTKELIKMMVDEGIIIKTMKELGYRSEDDFLEEFFVEYFYNDVIDFLEDNSEWKPAYVEKKVKLGYVESVLTYMTAYVAVKEGYYEEIFADIELIPFVNAPTIMDAFSAGLIDAAYNGIGGSITKKTNESFPVFIIGGGNAEGQSLVVRNDIKESNDFIGKIIATSGPGTTPDFLIRMLLNEEELTYKVR